MELKEIMAELKRNSRPEEKYGMEKFGLKFRKSFGVSLPVLRGLGKKIKTNHWLALQLWDAGYRETKILAGIVADIKKMDDTLVEKWVKGLEAWEDCDQTCINFFWKLPDGFTKAKEWSKREKEFEKRAGFALLAVLAWKDKKAGDKEFEAFFPLIRKAATDERNFVKKSVNWALRQIGKRNAYLNKKAIKAAEEISKMNNKTACWIAADALKELNSLAVQKRLKQ